MAEGTGLVWSSSAERGAGSGLGSGTVGGSEQAGSGSGSGSGPSLSCLGSGFVFDLLLDVDRQCPVIFSSVDHKQITASKYDSILASV